MSNGQIAAFTAGLTTTYISSYYPESRHSLKGKKRKTGERRKEKRRKGRKGRDEKMGKGGRLISITHES